MNVNEDYKMDLCCCCKRHAYTIFILRCVSQENIKLGTKVNGFGVGLGKKGANVFQWSMRCGWLGSKPLWGHSTMCVYS